MEIGTTTQTTLTTPTTAASPATEAMIDSDFETFLVMLTTQMKNQDPLDPIDSADYAVQLATFSGVEQQVRSNELLEGLYSQIGQLGMAQFAGWVGMEARVSAPVWFDGAPITLYPAPDPSSDRAVLVVTDTAGQEIARFDLPADGEPVDWAGTDADGNPMAPGLYGFQLESWRGDERIGTEVLPAFSEIVEVRSESGQVVLVLEGGVAVTAEEIGALRAPLSA